jgi:cyclic beta-1,2-glucan synthetase
MATFLFAPELTPGQDEVYDQPRVTQESATLYDHCIRALERAAPRGAHGLPLMGSGDWNDGMNLVGHEGKGESVWLAWFLADTYRQFAEIAEHRGDIEHATSYRKLADDLILAIEQQAWDGAWYRRAYFDDGTPLGSATNDECQIDSLPQSWAVIAGGNDRERIDRALAVVDERLVRRDDRLVLLFAPPFDHGPLQPGYIKGYVPGIRENGGQYTHASTWLILAHAKLGHGNKAMELVDLLNPVRLSDTPERVERYKVEPFVIAADVYGRAPHIGRGGWTWYTGSASWYFRVILESIMGFQRTGSKLMIDPRIPKEWKNFEITHRVGKTKYTMTVENPEGVEQGVKAIMLDGTSLPANRIDLIDDGRTHQVRVVMGPG